MRLLTSNPTLENYNLKHFKQWGEKNFNIHQQGDDQINSEYPYKYCVVIKKNKNSIIWEVVKGSGQHCGLKSHTAQVQIAAPTITSCATEDKLITSQFLIYPLGITVPISYGSCGVNKIKHRTWHLAHTGMMSTLFGGLG